MNSVLRDQSTTRLRADDFLTKVVGGQSQTIVAEFWEAGGGVVTTEVTVAQSQARQTQDSDAIQITAAAVAQAQARQTEDADAVQATVTTIAQDQARQEETAVAATVTAVTVSQDQPIQQQDAQAEAQDPVVSTDVVVDQAQQPQQQDAEAIQGIVAAVEQAQQPQQQDGEAVARDAVPSTDCTVDQSQAPQSHAVAGSSTVPPALYAGASMSYFPRHGPTIYITIPGGKKKRRKVAVKAAPRKPPEPDPRVEIGLKHLKRLAAIRLQPAPAPTKIDRAVFREALRSAFSTSISVSQTQPAATQQAEAKVLRSDEEMLLLLIA